MSSAKSFCCDASFVSWYETHNDSSNSGLAAKNLAASIDAIASPRISASRLVDSLTLRSSFFEEDNSA